MRGKQFRFRSFETLTAHGAERLALRALSFAASGSGQAERWAVADPSILFLLAFVLVVVGLIGTLLPAIPGAPLIFLGLVVAAWAEGFRFVGAGTLTVIGLMALCAYGVDLVSGALGARRFGASRLAVLGAAIGALVGLFFGIPGMILGPFVGVPRPSCTRDGTCARPDAQG